LLTQEQAEIPTSQGSPTNAGSHLLPHPPAVTVGRLQPLRVFRNRPLCACSPLKEFSLVFSNFSLDFCCVILYYIGRFCILIKKDIPMNKEREKEIMTVRQVAEYLQMDEHTIYKLARSGQIPSIKIAGQWRFL